MSIILLWVLVPAALFLATVFYVVSIGFRTRHADLRSEPLTPVETGRWPSLVTVRGLNEPRT
ncbi:hypothetical protein [Actinomadura sp.]|jgi:hypothetical protein|uniref:hypothetical protein n=1 Tax=Actinomadura sp. TaxID=1989 RepID=UPI0037C53283